MKRFDIMRRTMARSGCTLLATVLLVAGCEGENLFRALPGEGGEADASPPTARLQTPAPGTRVAVGDSVLVQVRVTDTQGLRSLELTGFALRGSAALGTQTRVPRFQPKTIVFDSVPLVRDTVITRYLLATRDSLPDDSVRVVATVRDRAGNQRADTARIRLGGPRVTLLSPTAQADVRAGTSLRVAISASDASSRIEQLVLQARGGVNRDTTLTLDPPRSAVDTAIVLQVPASARDSLRLRVLARSVTNDSAVSGSLALRLLPPTRDQRPPVVTFSVNAPRRGERTDSLTVTVSATDSTQVGRVGVTLLPIHRLASRTDTLTVTTRQLPGEQGVFRVSLAELGVPAPSDTSTVRVEVTAFAVDTAGNCAAATMPSTPLSEPCRVTGTRVEGPRSGARSEVLVVRGATLRLDPAADRIADIASDGSHVFLSNLSRNRVDVLPVGETRISRSIAVGARPWGLAFSPGRDLLYVANSGGTNISVVSPSQLVEVSRIQTPNVKLYSVGFSVDRVVTSAGDSVSIPVPSSVTRRDYSDRPQFIAATRNGNLIYSTRPTGAAPDGTVRIYHGAQQRLEIVTEYAEERVGDQLVIANADSAFLISGQPNRIQVCPRNRSTNPALDRRLPTTCVEGHLPVVQDSLARLGYDTRFLWNVNVAEVGLSDTTFVAVSGDHSTVAFGEGARDNARVMVFVDSAGGGGTGLVKSGEIHDVVGNTAERVVGLSLNANGSLGMARGREAYYFSRNLRLQGVAGTGGGPGGVDMHPANPSSPYSFVPGVADDGLAFIDVIHTFHFRRVGRIILRDPVTGPVRAVGAANGTLKIYAVTARGVVAADVLPSDF